MALWTNRGVWQMPRNATTTHTIDPTSATNLVSGAAFTPTTGRFLLAVVEGAVTSTTPTGWTLPANGSAVNLTGLYIWTRTAEAGSNSFSTTHNGSNYPMVVAIYEFATGTTFAAAATATGRTYNGANPTLSGVTVGQMVMAAKAKATITAAESYTWSAGTTEDVDVFALNSGTDGYLFTIGYAENYQSTSYAPTATSTVASGSYEALTWALNVAAAGSAFTGSIALSGSGTLTLNGTPAIPRPVALSGSGSLSVAGNPAAAGTMPLSGAGTLSLSGTPVFSAPLALSNSGALTLSGSPTFTQSVALSSSGQLSVTAAGIVSGSLLLSGSGVLTITGSLNVLGAAALSGVGILTVAGSPGVLGLTALSSSGALFIEGSPVVLGAVVLSAVSTLTVVGSAGAANIHRDIDLRISTPSGSTFTISNPTPHPFITGAPLPTRRPFERGSTVKLPKAGREYAKWVVNAPQNTALSVSFDNGTTWHELERPADTEARILVAGPQATDNPAGTVVLTTGRNLAMTRLTDTPEVIIRDAGSIDVPTET